jgi:hypothetical protein
MLGLGRSYLAARGVGGVGHHEGSGDVLGGGGGGARPFAMNGVRPPVHG